MIVKNHHLKKSLYITLFILCYFATSCASTGSTKDAGTGVRTEGCMRYVFDNDLPGLKANAAECTMYRTEEGVTMLMMATAKGHKSIAEFLIDRGVNVNSVNGTKQNALHYAVIHNQPEMVDFLIANGAQIKQNLHGITSLMMAVQMRDFSMVQRFNPSFEDVNIQADDGWSALYFSIRKEDQKIFDYLMSKGACVNFKDTYSQTPSDFATEVGWRYAINRIKKNGKVCKL